MAATACSEEDDLGNVTRWICDVETETDTIATLDNAVFYIVVDPGNPLPVFTQDD